MTDLRPPGRRQRHRRIALRCATAMLGLIAGLLADVLRPKTVVLCVFLNDVRDLEKKRRLEEIADPPELERYDYPGIATEVSRLRNLRDPLVERALFRLASVRLAAKWLNEGAQADALASRPARPRTAGAASTGREPSTGTSGAAGASRGPAAATLPPPPYAPRAPRSQATSPGQHPRPVLLRGPVPAADALHDPGHPRSVASLRRPGDAPGAGTPLRPQAGQRSPRARRPATAASPLDPCRSRGDSRADERRADVAEM